MRGQVLNLKNASPDGDDAAACTLGRADVLGRISDKTNLGCGPQTLCDFLHSFAEDVDAQFALVGEASELEIVVELGGFQLQPCHDLQIARANAEEFSGILQQGHQVANAW